MGTGGSFEEAEACDSASELAKESVNSEGLSWAISRAAEAAEGAEAVEEAAEGAERTERRVEAALDERGVTSAAKTDPPE